MMFAAGDDRRGGHGGRAADYVAKPVSPRELVSWYGHASDADARNPP
jgi:DNA-binding response OmpR family regulator